jgi:hypothetical protein
MRTWRDVARYHLVVPWAPLLIPWAILTCSFVINLVIFALAPTHHHNVMTSHGLVSVADATGGYTGGVASIYVLFLVIGASIIGRSLPFALALGVSRRSYYAGTTLLALALSVLYGLALTLLQVFERISHGWGVGLHFFRVAYIMNGPWYLTWFTSFVGLALVFFYGMWIGLVYRRWNLLGLCVFAALQVAVVVGAVITINYNHSWSAVGRFFTALSAAGLTGLLAALAVLLLAGGYATVRRVAV